VRTASDRERGTAVVEFALVLPLVLVMALAVIQVGLLARDRLLVEAAARAGARTAAVDPNDDAARDTAVGSAPGLDGASMSVTVTRAGTRGDPVTVRIVYADATRIPLVSWLFGASVSFDATATDRQEFG
jgi:Flp pilus assembly protein TadG